MTDDTSPRRRILDAAFALALEGGMECMQMRDVAARANVSTRTLHQLFPSKTFLLLSAVVDRAETTQFFPEPTDSLSSDPWERVVATFRQPTEMLLQLPLLTAGLMAALVSQDELAAPLLAAYRDGVYERAIQALTADEPTERERVIARALSQVWFAAMAGWVTGAEKPESVMESVEAAARLMLKD